jgi:hypothetical protein
MAAPKTRILEDRHRLKNVGVTALPFTDNDALIVNRHPDRSFRVERSCIEEWHWAVLRLDQQHDFSAAQDHRLCAVRCQLGDNAAIVFARF